MKVVFVLFILLYSSLFVAGENVKLHLISYLDNRNGEFTVINESSEGTFLLKLGIELNIDKAKVIFIEDLNSSESFCLRPVPYYQVVYLRTSTTFDRGNMMVMVSRPCLNLDSVAKLKLVVLDENKNKYTSILDLVLSPNYDVN